MYEIHNLVESIPENLDFGFCLVHDTTVKTLKLFNPKFKQSVRFKTQFNCPFQIYPSQGTVGPQQHFPVNISYEPPNAGVVVATGIFTTEEDTSDGPLVLQKVLKLSAVGKYSYITLDKQQINFGNLLIGKSDTKDLIIQNLSQVQCRFFIEPEDPDPGPCFALSQQTGLIPSGQSFLTKIKFQPLYVGTFSNVNYQVRTSDGCIQKFNCTGYANGYQANLSSRTCNFGEVMVGNTTTRVISVNNESNLPAYFQWFNDQANIFSFKMINGIIQPMSYQRITIKFRPKQTMSYYCRVFCSIKEGPILFCDLFGSCYDILYRPVPLTQKAIDFYRQKVLLGELHLLVAEEHLNFTQEFLNKDSQKKSKAGSLGRSTTGFFEEPNQIALSKEMFQAVTDTNRLVFTDQDMLDFNFCQENTQSDLKLLTVFNNTQANLHAMWVVDLEDPVIFKISPEKCDIKANDKMLFKISFCPVKPATYYNRIIQCFLYYKKEGSRVEGQDELGRLNTTQSCVMTRTASPERSQRSPGFSARSLRAIPPECLQIYTVGHTFPPSTQIFIPMVNCLPKKIYFPPCSAKDSFYQSVIINNTGDTPSFFKVIPEPTKNFRVFPQYGLIRGKSFQLLSVEFNPKTPKNYDFNLQIVFNHSLSNVHQIHLQAWCQEPQLTLKDGGHLYFPPCLPGVGHKDKLYFKNASRIGIEYNFEVPEKFSNELQVEPACGTLQPNQASFVNVQFVPSKEKEFKFAVPVKITKIVDQQQDANFVGYFKPGSGKLMFQKESFGQQKIYKTYEMVIHAAGRLGTIDIEPKELDFETVSIGFTKSLQFQISNVTDTSMYVKLRLESKDNQKSQQELETQLQAFTLDFKHGILAGHSKRIIEVKFQPNMRSQNDLIIVVYARQKLPNSPNRDVEMPNNKLRLKAVGDYPEIKIIDVRNEGQSTGRLWSNFQISEINSAIHSPLTKLEVMFNNMEISAHKAVKKLNTFKCNFGKFSYDKQAEPVKVQLTLQNIGGVPAYFKFEVSSAHELDLEPWADSGEPSREEMQEKHIMEKKIIDIQPKQGHLDLNQVCNVSLIYLPTEIGTWSVKVVFRIVHGKPVVLNLIGETLPNKKGGLVLRNDEFIFQPLPIGLRSGITQPIEIRNVGNGDITYNVDLAALQKSNHSENYNFSVLDIQHNQGTLQPFETQFLYAMFRPLEAKEYSIELPINVIDQEGTQSVVQLRLKGQGYERHSTAHPFTMFKDLPLNRQLYPQGLNAAFSVEMLDFGIVKQFQTSQRCVILYNMTTTHYAQFKFKETGLICGDELILDPINGEIPPGQHACIKLSLAASYVPTFYEGELECKMEWFNKDLEIREVRVKG